MTRWLVTGAAGMLGRDLTALLTARGEEFTALTRADLDITDPAPVAAAAVSALKPDVVVNCAAWTAVDAAEEHEARGPARSTATARPTSPPPAPTSARSSSTRPPTTSSTATRRPRTPRMRRPRPPARTAAPSWPASRRCSPRCPTPATSSGPAWLYGAHGKNFVQDHAPAGAQRHRPRRGRRPARPAHLDRRRRRADPALVDKSAPPRHLPRDQFGPDDVVRLRRGDLPAVPTIWQSMTVMRNEWRSDSATAYHRRIPDAGQAARPTACSATPPGTRPGSRRSATGKTHCTAACLRTRPLGFRHQARSERIRSHDTDACDRRCRVHRFELRALHRQEPPGIRGPRARRADLRG